MANTVTTQTINDGKRNLVVHVFLESDGAAGEETDTAIVDASTFNDAPTDLRLVCCHSVLAGFTAKLAWNADTNVPFLALAEGQTDFNYGEVCGENGGGLINNAGTGKNGDVLISTTGFSAAGDVGHITMHFRKQ